MSSDWDEIRRLAADLQRAQLSGSLQKLSERNCIEIVTRLRHLHLLDVIYTADGKEYLTPQHLQREVLDEVLAAGGRRHLADLAKTLNVDFSHVESQAKTIANQDFSLHLVLGQLVHDSYLDVIAQEINEKLQLDGTVSLAVLTKDYDLPADFLQEEIVRRLGTIIEGFRDEHDPKVILTTSYVARNRAKIRGALSAVTRPTPVASLLAKFNIQEKLFFSLVDELLKTNRLAGQISGGKKANKATFNPAIYVRAQTQWVDDFFAQNGYLEYDALSRLGISDGKSFAQKRFKDDNLSFLSTCCVGPQLVESLQTSIEDAVTCHTWLDVSLLLPSVLSHEDTRLLLKMAMDGKSGKGSASASQVFCHTLLISNDLLDRVAKSLEDLMPEQAKKDMESKKYDKLFAAVVGQGKDKFDVEEKASGDKKEERRKKAATGKGGGGTQGRETKTKSTKKKYGKGRKDDWEDESADEDCEEKHWSSKTSKKKQVGSDSQGGGAAATVVFMTLKVLEHKLCSIAQLSDCPSELFEELAGYYHPMLTKKYKSVLADLYQSALQVGMHDRRKVHGELQEKCNSVISLIRLFEKGTSCFEDGHDRKSLEKHLQRTLCTDIVNAVFCFVRDEHGLSPNGGGKEDAMTAEKRVKIMGAVTKEVGEGLNEMHKSIGGGGDQNVDTFVETFEAAAIKVCDLFVRKSDKKKDRQLIFNQRQSLQEQLSHCEDPALTLHLVVMLLFQAQNNALLHASGKFVPQILKKIIQDGLPDEHGAMLTNYQGLVMAALASGPEGAEQQLKQQLDEMRPGVKNLGMNAKKLVKAKDEADD